MSVNFQRLGWRRRRDTRIDHYQWLRTGPTGSNTTWHLSLILSLCHSKVAVARFQIEENRLA